MILQKDIVMNNINVMYTFTIDDLKKLCESSKKASVYTGHLDTIKKNNAIKICSEILRSSSDDILRANSIDLKNAVEDNMPKPLYDRLKLDIDRINAMADGLMELVALDDPIGNISYMKKRPNGLLIGKKSVPMGVVGVIYEARPNVTSDVFGLCFKTGNSCILKGGRAAENSNMEIVKVLKKGLSISGIDDSCISYIPGSDREITNAFMKMNEYVDVLIPRGGAGLIAAVVNNSTVPVIETGTGNCHVYVDESADFDMALNIIINAKTQRVGVCNAMESLLVHKSIAKEFLPMMYKELKARKVEIRTDSISNSILPDSIKADEDDWGKEYLDYIMSVRVVASIDEAIDHINRYNTGHSESIITKDYDNANKFLEFVDSACVYVNASTRFTDGHEFGFGAEIGISTQKLHARGPMGLDALCTYKYVIYGNGQIRD